MAYRYRVEDKKCATCRYWDGPRTIVVVQRGIPKYVEAVEGTKQFLCLVSRSGYKRAPSFRCQHFVPWEKIR